MKRSRSGIFLGGLLLLGGILWGLYSFIHKTTAGSVPFSYYLDALFLCVIGLAFINMAKNGKSAKYLLTKQDINSYDPRFFLFPTFKRAITFIFIIFGLFFILYFLIQSGIWINIACKFNPLFCFGQSIAEPTTYQPMSPQAVDYLDSNYGIFVAGAKGYGGSQSIYKVNFKKEQTSTVTKWDFSLAPADSNLTANSNGSYGWVDMSVSLHPVHSTIDEYISKEFPSGSKPTTEQLRYSDLRDNAAKLYKLTFTNPIGQTQIEYVIIAGKHSYQIIFTSTSQNSFNQLLHQIWAYLYFS